MASNHAEAAAIAAFETRMIFRHRSATSASSSSRASISEISSIGSSSSALGSSSAIFYRASLIITSFAARGKSSSRRRRSTARRSPPSAAAWWWSGRRDRRRIARPASRCPVCRKPIAPEAVPAASGRTLMAPAAAVRHHEGVGDHHDHLGAEQQERRLVEAGDAPDEVQQAPANCSARPNQISFSSEWRGAKRTQNRLPTR